MVMMVAVRPLLLLQRGEGLLHAVEIARLQRVGELAESLSIVLVVRSLGRTER
jgi:hypothetical protein